MNLVDEIVASHFGLIQRYEAELLKLRQENEQLKQSIERQNHKIDDLIKAANDAPIPF